MLHELGAAGAYTHAPVHTPSGCISDCQGASQTASDDAPLALSDRPPWLAQALFATDELRAAFPPSALPAIFKAAPEDASSDLLVQLAKLADGLTTDRYAAGNESELAVCVQPRMFKALVGKGHPEFSSARQQDAQEYLGHFLGMLQRMERKAGAAVFAPFSPLLAFSQEERIEVDGMACYKTTHGVTQLIVPIDLADATNKSEVSVCSSDSPRPRSSPPPLPPSAHPPSPA